MGDVHQQIQDAIGEVWEAVSRAEQLIASNCPGPHRYVQHRDHKPPWCNQCRYTEAGYKVPPA